MVSKDRINSWKLHPSQRGHFSLELYKKMAEDKNIILLVGDLGYGVFDNHFEDMPDQCINCGAAETAMMDIACGLALSDKIPVVYSITTFLIYRPFEVSRTYINHESIPVKLIGSGRDKDYLHDGFSHDASDVKPFLDLLPNIKQYWPETKEEIMNHYMTQFIYSKEPSFISLQR